MKSLTILEALRFWSMEVNLGTVLALINGFLLGAAACYIFFRKTFLQAKETK